MGAKEEFDESKKEQLEARIKDRLGVHSDSHQLATAYMEAVRLHAYKRTMGGHPLPASLSSERSELLMEISRQLDRPIDVAEIEALFLVTPTQARAMSNTLLAVQNDFVYGRYLEWYKNSARQIKGRTSDLRSGKPGTIIVFDSKEHRDMFVSYCERQGHETRVLRSDKEGDWAVAVSQKFPYTDLPPAGGAE